MRLKAGTKRASSAATTRSAARARLMPAPAATPFTDATTGLGNGPDRLDQRVVLVGEHAPELALTAPAAEVGAGAEPTPRAGDHHGPDVGIAPLRGLDGGEQLPAHRRVERVQRLGAVERERGHAGVGLDEQGRRMRGRASARLYRRA